jgi:signal transduction histidine kinase
MLYVRLPLLLLFLVTHLPAYAQLGAQSKIVQSLNDSAFNCRVSDPEKAARLNRRAFSLIWDHGDRIDVIVRSNTSSICGVLAFQTSNYKKALQNYFTALDLRLEAGDHGKIGDSYINIANLYYEIGNYKKALNYYRKSLYHKSIAKGPALEVIPAFSGLTQAYEALGKKDSLEKYYRRAFVIVDGLGNKTHNSIATLYSNYGQYNETNGNYDRAMEYYNKALEIEQQLNDLYGMAWTYHHMGIVSDYRNDSPAAKKQFHKAEELAIGQSDLETQRDLSESWMYLYTREKKVDSVAHYFERYKALNEEINEEKTSKSLLEIEAKYQTEKNHLRLKAAEAQKETFKWSLITGLLLAAFILFFLIRNYRQKQRIANMQVDLKNREINELLSAQETASYAAMLEGQDHERFRIAQDLHDRLGSTLAAIKLGMQGDPVATNDQNQQLVDTAIGEVRSIAHNLSGGNIERYGLNAALNELKTTIERSGKMQLNLYLEHVRPGNQLSIELYRIVQELVSNTLKHANATAITIQINDHPDNLNLIYEDDGSGFDQTAQARGMGLRNSSLRLKKWDGTLEIDTQPGRGTIVIINVPKNTAL